MLLLYIYTNVRKIVIYLHDKGGDPHGDGGDGGDKITEWQAAWNVTNAIQVGSTKMMLQLVSTYRLSEYSELLTELGASLFEIAQSLFAPLFWERWRSIRIRAMSKLTKSKF